MDKDKQMEFLFEEGGIADDGMNRDPISGNEVPPGSLAEEVRDDIPAQLSEGEYVVPADVVRYYGVKFFEDLRSQAKSGLMDMERNGRIGGEQIPVDEVVDSQLSPEEEAELRALMGMAVGGMVMQPPMQSNDPFMAQRNLYTPPSTPIGNTRNFNEGGLAFTEADTQATFDPSTFSAGFSFARSDSPIDRTSEAGILTLYGPAGEIVNFVLPLNPVDKQRYDQLLSQGYSTQRQAQAEISTELTDTDSGRDNFVDTQGQETPTEDLSELSVEELQANLNGISTIGKIASGLATAVNPLIGLGVASALRSNISNIIAELEARNVDTSEYRDQFGRDVFGGGVSLYDGLQDQEGSRPGVDFGDTWLGDALGFDGRVGVQGPSLTESREGARRDFSSSSTSSSSRSDRDSSEGGSSPSTSESSGAQSGSSTGGTASVGATGAGAPGLAGSATGAGPDGRDAVGPMNKGGFVSRRNKKNKK